MESQSQTQQQPQQFQSLTKLSFDSIKQNDRKFIFEVLSSQPQNRTIADLDNLSKILMHIEPIKKIQNMSAIYFICKRMTLVKYKSKDIIYEDSEKADSLYIVLNGKVAFYRKSTQYFDNDQVILLNAGSCFGKLYQWKIKFMPISVQETLIAVANRNQVNKIPIHLSYERQIMIEQLKNSDIFLNCQATVQQFQKASKLLVLNKVPCGSYLIREGQTPKALFYILKGRIKKVVNQNNQIIEIKVFSQGQHCPSYLKGTYNYDLISETSCQVITIPKKMLKMVKNPLIDKCQQLNTPLISNIQKQLIQKKQWKAFKQNYIAKIIDAQQSQPSFCNIVNTNATNNKNKRNNVLWK